MFFNKKKCPLFTKQSHLYGEPKNNNDFNKERTTVFNFPTES